ncbi:hypothetical protein Prudu_013790 [Prunus dulcis]|uniref:Uncharacterized protein n=1 Tax=Prunus dulcis TaxID=3755 RepID=A0A4Y1RFV9_PRUDU|nr:hypothetical protein Prudu_013790 [Prunus dulcis]
MGLNCLEKLSLANCNLTDGAIPNCIWSLPHIDHLDISGNHFHTLPNVSGLSKLNFLSLDHCTNLCAITDLPKNLCKLSANYCTALKKLPNFSEMSSNYVTDGDPFLDLVILSMQRIFQTGSPTSVNTHSIVLLNLNKGTTHGWVFSMQNRTLGDHLWIAVTEWVPVEMGFEAGDKVLVVVYATPEIYVKEIALSLLWKEKYNLEIIAEDERSRNPIKVGASSCRFEEIKPSLSAVCNKDHWIRVQVAS